MHRGYEYSDNRFKIIIIISVYVLHRLQISKARSKAHNMFRQLFFKNNKMG